MVLSSLIFSALSFSLIYHFTKSQPVKNKDDVDEFYFSLCDRLKVQRTDPEQSEHPVSECFCYI